MPCQGGFRGGQTPIVASEQRPLQADSAQKQETPAGGPAGVDGGQKRSCRRFGHRERFVPVAWKQEIASDGCRQLAEPPDRRMLIAEISISRLRPIGVQFKRPARVLHGVSGSPQSSNMRLTQPTATAQTVDQRQHPGRPLRRPMKPGIGASKLKKPNRQPTLYTN